MGPMMWKTSLLPDGWRSTLSAFSFVVARIVTGKSDVAADTGAIDIFAAAEAAGAERWGWGWGYLRDAEAAASEGVAAGKAAKKYAVKVYVLNAEKHAFGKEGEPKPADIPGNFAAFASAFRAHAPGVLLSYGGYSQVMVGSSVLDSIVGLFDAWGPMVYGTKRSTIAKKWANEYARARTAGIWFTPITGTGRTEAASGATWGFAYGSGGDPGLVELQADMPAEAIQPFCGGGTPTGGSMLVAGNAQNPPLPTLARKLAGDEAVT